MRFLNKIIFINSAAIRYSEVRLDGNIHLIGTQGVGKSTILRAILFFYNADTQRLGIPVEKKSYPDYYFPYADSSIIYEVACEDGFFTVLTYKTMNRISFRFISSPYRPELFIDDEGVPYPSDRIRSVLDKQGIAYSGAISTYEEYRNILYGHADNKRDYSCYALMEGGAYQNMIRTIQNVLLNSRLEADYIKQTIISSLNEENSVIDLSRYRSHLAGFEAQLHDIALFQEADMERRAAGILMLSDDIRRRELRVNDLCRQLRAAYLRTERLLPDLAQRMHAQEESRTALYRQREQWEADTKERVAVMEAELAVLRNALLEAEAKRMFYADKEMESVIERCGKLELLQQEQESLVKEQELLSSEYKEASVLRANLIANLRNELVGFENERRKQALALEADLNGRKEVRRAHYRQLRKEVRVLSTEEKDRLLAERERCAAEVAAIRMRIENVRGQVGSSDELEAVRMRLTTYETDRKQAELRIRELRYELNCLTKETEADERRLEEDFLRLEESNGAKVEALGFKIAELTEFLNHQKDSFFNWLSENKPGWEQTIGQVCDERLLYGKNFVAELADGDSFYGVRFTPSMRRSVKTKADYLAEKLAAECSRDEHLRFVETARQDLTAACDQLRKRFQAGARPIKEDIYQAEYDLEQLEVRKREDEARLKGLQEQVRLVRQEELRKLDEELAMAEDRLRQARLEIEDLEKRLEAELASLARQEQAELDTLDRELALAHEAIAEEVRKKREELAMREREYDQAHLERLMASGSDPLRLAAIRERLAFIEREVRFARDMQALVIEYLKDKREILDKVADWSAESNRLQQAIEQEREGLKRRLVELNRSIAQVDAEWRALKESNRVAQENREEYHRSTYLDWFTSHEEIFSLMQPIDGGDGDCRSLVREITIRVSEQSQKLSELRKEITAYTGRFSEENVFAFKTSFSEDAAYLDFACDLKEFVEEDKISEFKARVNMRNTDIFRQATADTKGMLSQEGGIRRVVEQINADFKEKNFVGIIQCIEMRIDPSQNKIVNLLKEIKRFNEESGWDLGQNLFSSAGDSTSGERATMLLRELIRTMESYPGHLIRLTDFFDLKFRVVENRNDTGFVERLTNVGSEGTDILVKSMVNIMLLNVFKQNASAQFADFKLHCMMDEIGKLHPNNVAGILKFANDRDILLINGSPTEQDALAYKHIYKLEKDADSFTRIRRVVTQFD